MQAILDFLSGKKTYLIAVVVAILALVQACDVQIPPALETILAALGLVTLRAGVKKAA